MTITILITAPWLIMSALTIIGLYAIYRNRGPVGAYDFVTPLIGGAILIGLVVVWAAFLLGRYVR